MKTRSQKKKPEVIEILSEQSHSQLFKNDDSSCSDAYSSNDCSSSSNNNPIFNLVPQIQTKTKKTLKVLKNYLNLQKSQANNEAQLQFQRAPVLNLLRPIAQKQQDTGSKQQQSEDDASIEPPSLDQLLQDEKINQMSKPRKKPKLMDELEAGLHLPAEEYKITGQGRALMEKRRKQLKKRDYLIDKKFKEYKKGKKKDTVSNQVFNAIEDFFA